MPNSAETSATADAVAPRPRFVRIPRSSPRTLFLRRRRRRLWVRTHRSLRLVIGWLLVILGAILTPTPVPIGLILLALGLYLVAKESMAMRRAVCWLRRRVPRLSRGMNDLKPRVGRGLRHFIDRTDPDQKR